MAQSARRANAGALHGEARQQRRRVDSGSDVVVAMRRSRPPPLAYALLDRFVRNRCVCPAMVPAVKRALYVRSLGLGELERNAARRGVTRHNLLREMLQNSSLKMSLWQYLAIEEEVELPLRILSSSPSTYEYDAQGEFTVQNVVGGSGVWLSPAMSPARVVSIIVAVPDGSRVIRLEIASLSRADHLHQVSTLTRHGGQSYERVVAPWGHFGIFRGVDIDEADEAAPSAHSQRFYSAASVPVETSISVFRIEAQHNMPSPFEVCAGIASFRAYGVAPKPGVALFFGMTCGGWGEEI